jgi:hypothetical protein
MIAALVVACLSFPAQAADTKQGFDPIRNLGMAMVSYGMALGIMHGMVKACKFSNIRLEDRDSFKRRGEEMNRTIGTMLPDSLKVHDTFAKGVASHSCDPAGVAEAMNRLVEAQATVDRDYETWFRLDQLGFYRLPGERRQPSQAASPSP